MITREPEYINKTFHINVWDKGRQVMPTFYLEHMGNDDEYALTRAWCELKQQMEAKHNFKPETQECRIYDPQKVLERDSIEGIHYEIIDKPLYCKLNDLEVGDVFPDWRWVEYQTVSDGKTFTCRTRQSFRHVIEEGDPLLGRHTLGYFRFNLVGGKKFDAWKLQKEAVAQYNNFTNQWLWKG
jgi:hypothetical protein